MGMVERSFADLEYESKKHKTGRELFLQKMEDLIRWDQLVEAIKPYYPQSAKGESALPVRIDSTSPLRPTLLQPQRSSHRRYAL